MSRKLLLLLFLFYFSAFEVLSAPNPSDRYYHSDMMKMLPVYADGSSQVLVPFITDRLNKIQKLNVQLEEYKGQMEYYLQYFTSAENTKVTIEVN